MEAKSEHQTIIDYLSFIYSLCLNTLADKNSRFWKDFNEKARETSGDITLSLISRKEIYVQSWLNDIKVSAYLLDHFDQKIEKLHLEDLVQDVERSIKKDASKYFIETDYYVEFIGIRDYVHVLLRIKDENYDDYDDYH